MYMLQPELRGDGETGPRFFPGQLVRHKRYKYRGVVVDYDEKCAASDVWYKANKTQPERDQPWYHVLVDDSQSITYPAESSLEPDPDPQPINHPMLPLFFEGFDGTSYTRNDRPWPGQAGGGGQ